MASGYQRRVGLREVHRQLARVTAGRTRFMRSWLGVGWPLRKSSFDASIRSTEEDLGVWEGDNLQNSHQSEGRVNSQDRRQDPWAAPGALGVPDQGLKAGRAQGCSSPSFPAARRPGCCWRTGYRAGDQAARSAQREEEEGKALEQQGSARTGRVSGGGVA